MNCGKKFIGKNAKFCFMNCYKNYEDLLDTRIHEAVENDPNHAKNLSE